MNKNFYLSLAVIALLCVTENSFSAQLPLDHVRKRKWGTGASLLEQQVLVTREYVWVERPLNLKQPIDCLRGTLEWCDQIKEFFMIEEDVNFRSHKEIESFLRFILSEAGEIDKDLHDSLFDDEDKKRLRKAKRCLNRLVNDDLRCDFEIIKRKRNERFDAIVENIRILI